MTVTIDRVETDQSQTDQSQATTYDSTARPSVSQLLGSLRDAVADVADADPDELGSRSPAGRELLRLARLARAATAGLGRYPGTVVSEAPGVVVVRELVAATRTLAAAIA